MSHQGKRIQELIGAIVLTTQEIEHHLKFITPYMGTDEIEVDRKLANRDKLKKQTFGKLVGEFLKNSKFNSVKDREHFEHLIKFRNELIHHFPEIYGSQIKSGRIDSVISALQTHLSNINYFRDSLAQLAVQLLDLICESSLDRSSESEQLRELVEVLRSRVAS